MKGKGEQRGHPEGQLVMAKKRAHCSISWQVTRVSALGPGRKGGCKEAHEEGRPRGGESGTALSYYLVRKWNNYFSMTQF